MGKFNCVVQQVIQHLLDFSHITVYKKLFTGEHKFNGNVLLLAGSFKRGGGIADDGVDVKIRLFQYHTPGIQVIQGKQAVGELGETLRFVQDDFQIFFMQLRGDGAVQHGFQITLDRGQG